MLQSTHSRYGMLIMPVPTQKNKTANTTASAGSHNNLPVLSERPRFAGSVSSSDAQAPNPSGSGGGQQTAASFFERAEQAVIAFVKAFANANPWVKPFVEKLAQALGVYKKGYEDGLPVKKLPPRLLMTDRYNMTSSELVSDEAKDYSCYNVTFRRRPSWMNDLGVSKNDTRFIFYGLNTILSDLFDKPITKEEVDAADAFAKEAAENGQPIAWDRAVWDRVVDENNGVLPLHIEALPEGSTFFPGEPMMQVTAEDGYGELAGWFETKLLQVWSTTEEATLSRHWLEYNEKMVTRYGDKSLTPDQIHNLALKMTADFSDRASTLQQDSTELSQAWLTSHGISSTASAVYKTKEEGGRAWVSMSSLAHRMVQGHAEEKDAFRQLYDAISAKGGLGSYVADTYNYQRAVKEHLIPLAHELETLNTQTGQNGVICVRPDSGDKYQQIRFALDEAVKEGLFTTIETRDGKQLKAMTTLRVVQADGLSFKEIQELNERLVEDGYSPPMCVYYGVGGGTRNVLARDNMSVAMKLAEVGKEHRPVMKFAPDSVVKDASGKTTNAGKRSVPGRIKLVRESGMPSVRDMNEDGQNELITWYDGREVGDGQLGRVHQSSMADVQSRVRTSPSTAKPSEENLLDVMSLISPAIQQKADALESRYVQFL